MSEARVTGPMRVLFDAFWWHHGPAANRSVLREIIFGWARTYPKDELILALRSRDRDAPTDDLPYGARVVRTRLFPHAVSNTVELGVLARREFADVIVAHNYTPATGNSAVFIHDLLFEEHPEWFSRKERLYFAPMSRLARRASSVITSSQAEAMRIERLHPNLSPVSAIGLAVPSALADAASVRPSQLNELGEFVLSVGRMNVRKNLETTVAAARLATAVSAERPLVVVGSAEYSGVTAALPTSVREMVAVGELVFLGWVRDGELRWLYENAAAFVFLSRDEGFGLPPVEAAYFGSRVIVSDVPVLREVTGGLATYVNPNSSLDVARAIDDVVRLAREGSDADRGSSRNPRHEWDGIARSLRASIRLLAAQGES